MSVSDCLATPRILIIITNKEKEKHVNNTYCGRDIGNYMVKRHRARKYIQQTG